MTDLDTNTIEERPKIWNEEPQMENFVTPSQKCLWIGRTTRRYRAGVETTLLIPKT